MLSISSLAAGSSDEQAEKRSIGEFVLPDGSIDLEAVRKSGYQGPLDLEGLDIRLDRKTGEPLMQVSSSSASPSDPDDIYWDNSLSPSFQEINGPVYALAVYDSNLIMAGEFTAAGDASANYIASWDGTCWSALGSGMNDRVDALTVYNSRLTVGGSFTVAGGKVSAYMAQWTKPSFICGDVNNDGTPLTVLDLTYLIDDIFRGGPAAAFPQSADLNGDGTPATVRDLTFMIDNIFRGGPAPTCGL